MTLQTPAPVKDVLRPTGRTSETIATGPEQDSKSFFTASSFAIASAPQPGGEIGRNRRRGATWLIIPGQ
jgi:hypothetical protein